MAGRFRVLLPVVLAVLIALASTQNVFAALVLDQKQETLGHGVLIALGLESGQEFVPSLTPLAGVAINIDTHYNGPCTLMIRIRLATGTHGLTGALLGSASQALPGTLIDSWATFTFSPALTVTPGQMYVITVSGTGANPIWNYANFDAYAVAGCQSITFGASQPSDMTFRTYSQTAEAGTVGGIVLPTNSLTILAPYLAIIGLVATAAVAVKKRKS